MYIILIIIEEIEINIKQVQFKKLAYFLIKY